MSHTMTLVHPALRTEQLGFSDIVKIRNRVLALKQSGASILQLEGGEPYSPTPAFIKDAMKAALDADQTRYAPSSGIPSLLTAIKVKLAERNGIAADESNLIVVSGGMHGLFCAFQVSVNPGDEVVFFSPYWTPIKDLMTYAGGVPVRIPWAEVRAGELEKALQKRLTPKTRVLYVNSPANPTGDVLSRSQIETIARFAIANNLVVISDEAYEDLIYDGEHVSIASLPEMFSRTISVYTLSKSYAMTGWRIGYICADASLMNVIKKLVLNTVNGISTPTQFAAAAAVADRSGQMVAMCEQYRIRRDILVRGVREAGFDCVPPAGAFYLFVDVRKRLGGDSWKAMNELLEKTGIATVPGVVFGPEGEGFLRMSYSNPIETLEKVSVALKKL